MKSDKFLPTEDKRVVEASIAAQLNRAKHKNPPTVLNALGISTGLIAEKIVVTWTNGSYWVGTTSQEYCAKIGASRDEVDANLRALGL